MTLISFEMTNLVRVLASCKFRKMEDYDYNSWYGVAQGSYISEDDEWIVIMEPNGKIIFHEMNDDGEIVQWQDFALNAIAF